MKPSAALLLGSLLGAFALLTAVIPFVAGPVPVALECDRATCTWAAGDGKQKTFPVAVLSTARVEPFEGGTRIAADGEKLSNTATGPDVQEAHARAVAAMQAFASGSEPKLSLSYPVGGGAPGMAYWGRAIAALLFSGMLLGVWWKKRGEPA